MSKGCKGCGGYTEHDDDCPVIVRAERDVMRLQGERAEARAEAAKYRAALELIAAPKRPDGTYNRDREACEQLARDALNACRGDDCLSPKDIE